MNVATMLPCGCTKLRIFIFCFVLALPTQSEKSLLLCFFALFNKKLHLYSSELEKSTFRRSHAQLWVKNETLSRDIPNWRYMLKTKLLSSKVFSNTICLFSLFLHQKYKFKLKINMIPNIKEITPKSNLIIRMGN